MLKLTDLQRAEKINQGGAWEGTIWAPQGPTLAAQKAAAEHGNSHDERLIVRGFLRRVLAFDSQQMYALTVHDDDVLVQNLLLPDWHSLGKDLDASQLEGQPIELEFAGTAKLKNGNTAHNVNIYPLR